MHESGLPFTKAEKFGALWFMLTDTGREELELLRGHLGGWAFLSNKACDSKRAKALQSLPRLSAQTLNVIGKHVKGAGESLTLCDALWMVALLCDCFRCLSRKLLRRSEMGMLSESTWIKAVFLTTILEDQSVSWKNRSPLLQPREAKVVLHSCLYQF